ncbi:MAG: aspartate--tRNA ligase [Clostridia bacterium]|nr:aspartate--tRNA ligase [Clostridia bacterium]
MDKIQTTYRTHTCGELTKQDIGKQVMLSGWISTIRDHGGITFVDLRDHYGITQLVLHVEPTFKLSKESVISIKGTVIKRADETINTKLKTGEVEVDVSEISLISACQTTPPFEIDDSKSVSEELRLKYRFLDLRNPDVKKNIVFRSKVIQSLRSAMIDLDFTEVQTPILTASSPEGARDFIVPSRLHHGQFYALPQAPQQFKQLLMASGFDKYFQIAPCFRDEDARADRSPGEFYQLDMEMSFATQEDVFKVMEEVLPKIFEKYGKYKIDKVPFERIPYKTAIETYGTDKPDLRNPLKLKDLTKVFEHTTFGAFKDKTVKAICVCCEGQGRKFYDELTDFALEQGAKGLAWVKVQEGMEMVGPILKFMTDQEKQAMIEACDAKVGDSIFIIADPYDECHKIIGALRTEIATKLDLIEKDIYKFCWIIDFPMFELDKETGKIDFSHNPFSMPQGGLEALKTKQPLDVLAYQYDIVVNGIELSSGAVRNHDPEIMTEAFKIAGYTEQELQVKFGALYTAFKFGAPPHAGIAPGVDRMIMLLLDEPSIREIIAFPMNKKAQDLMMGAPGYVTEKQLREVHIKIR